MVHLMLMDVRRDDACLDENWWMSTEVQINVLTKADERPQRFLRMSL